MTVQRVQTVARQAGRWSAIGLGFTLPLWALLDGLLMGLLAASWLGSGAWREKWRLIRTNPVAVAALLLFAWLLLGTLWGAGSLADRALAIKKYGELLFIPILMSLMLERDVRTKALWGFAIGLIVTLAWSYALWLGLPSPGGLIKGEASNPFVFKRHITHNILMAFGGLLFAVLAWRTTDRRWRIAWSTLSVLAVCNVLLMVQGRTGYLVLAALMMLFLHVIWGWKGTAGAVVLVGLLFASAYAVSPSFHQRIDQTVMNAQNWNPAVAGHEGITERLEFYDNTLEIIREHPLIGVGTGGFAGTYAKHVAPKGLKPTSNPHNQYLLIMAQVGIVGVVLLLWLFVQQWRAAEAIADPGYRVLARGLVLTVAVGSLFNALLIDHTEKLLYCWFTGLFYSQPQQPPHPSLSPREREG